MRLETMILINRAPFKELQLNFSDENVLVLSGINGTGKTTIISYIVDAFYELARIAYHNEFESKNNKYYRISSGLYSMDGKKPSIVYMRYKEDDGTNRDYIDIRGNCPKDQYDQLVPLEDKIQYDVFQSTLIEASNVKKWSCSDEKWIQTTFDKSIMTYFPAYRYEMPSYLNDPYKTELVYNTAMQLAGYLNSPIEVVSDLPNIANWIMDVVLDRQVYPERTLGLFEQINDVLTSILISKVGSRTRMGIGQRNSGLERIAIMNRDIDNVQVY